MGGCIARYLIEVIDGQKKSERVRQLIGLGPPNNGSALAEIFFDPDKGPGVIEQLTGSFVPPGFKPMRTGLLGNSGSGADNLPPPAVRHQGRYRLPV